MGQDKLLGLQVLRALAAFIVLVGHVQYEALTMAKDAGVDFAYKAYPNNVGVDIFFVISGFVIVYASQKFMGQGKAFGPFMLRRFLRIAPIYWFYTSLLAVVVLAVPSAAQVAQFDVWHLVQSYLFVPHTRPSGDAIRPLLSLGWSLNYEMYFYLIFGALLFLPLKRLIVALTTYFVVTVGLGYVLTPSNAAISFWLDPIVLEFLCGAILAYLFISGIRLPHSFSWIGIVLAILGLLALLIPALHGTVLITYLQGFIGVCLVASVTLPLKSKNHTPPRTLTALGDSSYSLYLAHPFGIGFMKVVWGSIFGAGTMLWGYVLSTIIICLIGGHIAYLIIERPIINWSKKITNRKKT